jgi:hypothetical protein
MIHRVTIISRLTADGPLVLAQKAFQHHREFLESIVLPARFAYICDKNIWGSGAEPVRGTIDC